MFFQAENGFKALLESNPGFFQHILASCEPQKDGCFVVFSPLNFIFLNSLHKWPSGEFRPFAASLECLVRIVGPPTGFADGKLPTTGLFRAILSHHSQIIQPIPFCRMQMAAEVQ